MTLVSSYSSVCFDELHDRCTSWSTKWERYKGRNVIPMWVADMDFRTAPSIIDALRKRIDHGIFGYSQPPHELVETVVDYLARRHDWRIHPEWIVWVPSVISGFHMASRAIGKPGQDIVMPIPTYYNLVPVAKNTERRHAPVPLHREGDMWIMDFDRIEAVLKDPDRSPSVFMLCNPQNPTGRCYTREELQALADLLLKYRVAICSDEIHCDLLLDSRCKHFPIASLSEDLAQLSVTLMSPTKTFNIPGLNGAYAVIPNPGLRRRFEAVRLGMTPGLSPLSLCAALAAYQDGWEWHAELIRYLRGNAEHLHEVVQGLDGVDTTPVEATYLAWVDVRDLGLAEPTEHFCAHGVGLYPGDVFEGPGFLRFNFGCPRAVLEEALERFANAVSAAHRR